MLNIKHILFPMDFSARSCGAVPHIEAVAKRFGAKITLISVAQPVYAAGMGDPGGPVIIDTEDMLNELKQRLDSALVKELSALRVDRVADIGDPAAVIVDFAKKNEVDLIMMPTHGYGPFRSLLLGSVTAKVLHDSEIPVWTSAHMEDPPSQQHLPVRAILCSVDGTPGSVPLMKWSSRLSKDLGASLRLVHVIRGIEGWPARQADRQFEEEMRAEARKQIEALQASAELDAPLCVAVGSVAEGVREEARRHGADLIVIGRGVLHETLGRLRTHSYNIIRNSPCPVVSV
jgi:nucleotide-binding universal stress UspA family protein